MSERVYKFVDKAGWGAGPWQVEPDRVEWERDGFACMVIRHFRYGNLNGYAGVPFDHKLWGRDYVGFDIDVHGGLSFSGQDPDNAPEGPLWWFGFDCGHFMDLKPGLEATIRRITPDGFPDLGIEIPDPFKPWYKPLAYVRAEVESLREQLARISELEAKLRA